MWTAILNFFTLPSFSPIGKHQNETHSVVQKNNQSNSNKKKFSRKGKSIFGLGNSLPYGPCLTFKCMY